MNEAKAFHIGDVLSVTSGKLVSPEHVGGLYKLLGWMTGDTPMTHQLPRFADECKPFLAEQHPELAATIVPSGLNSEGKVLGFLETLYAKFGETVEIQPIPEIEHTAIDPISEIKMRRPDIQVIAVGL